MTPEDRERFMLETYEATMVGLVQRIDQGDVTAHQVRGLLVALLLQVDHAWNPIDYRAVWQQSMQN